nr:DNA helicase UvrD [Pseudomonadota bacterium]
MDYIADLHIHSPYSRATSPQSTLAGLAGWARVKGIQVIGTGDFTHPGWFSCLKE